MKTKSASTVPMSTYLLNMKDGTKQKITCPSEWTITFGPLTPGSKDAGNGYHGIALRIRDGQRQKAVFTGVESFRDTSMGIEVEVIKTQEETFYKEGENGERKNVVVQGTVKEWQNPDAPGKREKTETQMGKILITQEKV